MITYVDDDHRLYRNVGGARFEDVSSRSGLGGQGLVGGPATVFDFDGDGFLDVYVGYFGDYLHGGIPTVDRDNQNALPNQLFRNLGGMRFADATQGSGTADTGWTQAVSHVDFDRDGRPGMLIKESDMLYMSHVEQGRLVAYAPSRDVERGSTSTGWAWDAEFLDFGHDGDDDLYLVNGTNDYNTFSMVYRRFQKDGASQEYLFDHGRESNVFFLNEDGKLRNVSPRSGADFAGNSRSTAYLDFDGDGDLDIAVNNFHAPARVLRNDAEKRGRNWLKLRLVGDPARRSNRDAIGARIVVTSEDGPRLHREVQGGSGYLSMNPKQQHFGLGRSRSADVQITWPNGETQALRALAANRAYTVRQGSGRPLGE